MDPHDDSRLLESFVRDNDQQAFATLVERYASLVFGTALRMARDRSLAEEVAQNVFATLAKRAGSLDGRGGIGGWLHRCTCLETRHRCRSEKRYRERMKRFSNEEVDHDQDDEGLWESILPILDNALTKLSDMDRQVVLLHYYEGLTFPQIATHTGGKPAALQKRCVRALAKLSSLLQKRGVVISAAAIGSGMSAQLTKAAPSSLVAKWSAVPISTSLSVSQSLTNTLLTMKLGKIALGTVVLGLLCTPLVWQGAAMNRAKARVQGLTTANTILEQSIAPEPGDLGRVTRSSHGGGLDLRKLAERAQAADAGNVLELVSLPNTLKAQDAETLEILLAAIPDLNAPESARGSLARMLLLTLLEKSSQSAVRAGAPLILAFSGTYRDNIAASVHLALDQWAKTSPSDALAWFESQDTAGAFDEPAIHAAHEVGVRERLISGLAVGLYADNPTKALELIAGLGKLASTQTIATIGANTTDLQLLEPLAQHLVQTTEGRQLRSAFGSIIEKAAREYWEPELSYAPKVARFIAKLTMTDDRRVDAFVRGLTPPTLMDVDSVPNEHILGSLKAIDEFAPERIRSEAKGKLLGEIVSSRSRDQAFLVIEDLRQQEQVDDRMLAAFIELAARASSRHAELFEIATSIEEEPVQHEAFGHVYNAWSDRDPDAAKEAIESIGFDESDFDRRP